jgi:hypothetical protein
MKKMNALLAGVLMVGASATVGAENYEGYVGINYMTVETDDRFFGGDTVETGDVFVRLGAKINHLFSSELRVGGTVQPEKQGGAEFKNDYYVGGMLRLQKQYGGFAPYVGTSFTYIKESLSGFGSETLRDHGYAAGLDIGLGEKLGINVEYWVITGSPSNDVDRKGLSLGVFHRL